MTHLKRLLALLLAMILSLGLALPVFAEGETEPDPAMPVITVQPESVDVNPGGSFALTIGEETLDGDTIWQVLEALGIFIWGPFALATLFGALLTVPIWLPVWLVEKIFGISIL